MSVQLVPLGSLTWYLASNLLFHREWAMSWIDRRRLWMLPLKWRALGSSRSCPPICLSSCRTSYNTNQGMLSVDLPNFHQTSQQVNMFLHYVFRIVYCNLGKAMNTTTCRLSLWSYGLLAWEQAPLISSLWNLHHTVWEKTKPVLFVCLFAVGRNETDIEDGKTCYTKKIMIKLQVHR